MFYIYISMSTGGRRVSHIFARPFILHKDDGGEEGGAKYQGERKNIGEIEKTLAEN